ncbi:hypothetical protein PP637_gp45 [Arthrobacter phage Persistence]|uniref:Uncharacterized protein n=1 Tax=Arthrobacter phage Persistence TaxID=2836007 RepID=A0A8F3ILJ0_9CAUD|nr:hypothetical protein PP637_gp45 [Arthrobacter phage Persistence]QWY79675.1 hypothetical protein SEA_PERSISTENCE_45 [Arthrobacter phage Persistence]
MIVSTWAMSSPTWMTRSCMKTVMPQHVPSARPRYALDAG